MNLLIRHTEYLLAEHNCVVVPGLGAFLAHEQSAVYDRVNHKWHSPVRRYAFNQSLNVSDGILIMSIARSNNNDYDKARRLVSHAVERIKAEIARTGEFKFGKIGRLENSDDGALQFYPYSSDKITPLVNWIHDFECPRIDEVPAEAPAENVKQTAPVAVPVATPPALPPVAEEQPIVINEPVAAEVEPEPDPEPAVEPKRKEPVTFRFSSFVRTAIGAAAAILIALVVSTPLSVNNTYSASTVPTIQTEKPIAKQSDSQNADNRIVRNEPSVADKSVTSPSTEKDGTETVKEQQPSPQQKTEKPVKEIKVNNNATSTEKKTSRREKTVRQPVRFRDADQYLLVVASLPTREKAEAFITQHTRGNDLQLDILDCGDKFRVYAATGLTAAEAKAQMKKHDIASRFSNGWVALR